MAMPAKSLPEKDSNPDGHPHRRRRHPGSSIRGWAVCEEVDGMDFSVPARHHQYGPTAHRQDLGGGRCLTVVIGRLTSVSNGTGAGRLAPGAARRACSHATGAMASARRPGNGRSPLPAPAWPVDGRRRRHVSETAAITQQLERDNNRSAPGRHPSLRPAGRPGRQPVGGRRRHETRCSKVDPATGASGSSPP